MKVVFDETTELIVPWIVNRLNIGSYPDDKPPGKPETDAPVPPPPILYTISSITPPLQTIWLSVIAAENKDISEKVDLLESRFALRDL